MDWPNTLVSDIARRRCVLVLGSGISRQSQNQAGVRPKMWFEFLEAGRDLVPGAQAVRDRISRLMRDGDLLTACEVIKNKIGDAAFRELVRTQYLTPAFAPAAIHDSIIGLDCRITATPNFDKIYESRINHLQNGSVAVKPYYDTDLADVIRGMHRVVVKIHGSVDRPADMIFTRTEYARARGQHRAFYDILRSLIATNTFLFLGCGLNDPDIRLLLEDYAFHYEFSRPHYFVLPERQVHSDFIPTYESSLNIKILEYDPQHNHAALQPAINDLVGLVDADRITLAGTLQW